jgi:hypothetical protein
MKPERSFRRLCLLAEALAIEEEDFRQQDRLRSHLEVYRMSLNDLEYMV